MDPKELADRKLRVVGAGRKKSRDQQTMTWTTLELAPSCRTIVCYTGDLFNEKRQTYFLSLPYTQFHCVHHAKGSQNWVTYHLTWTPSPFSENRHVYFPLLPNIRFSTYLICFGDDIKVSNDLDAVDYFWGIPFSTNYWTGAHTLLQILKQRNKIILDPDLFRVWQQNPIEWNEEAFSCYKNLDAPRTIDQLSEFWFAVK